MTMLITLAPLLVAFVALAHSGNASPPAVTGYDLSWYTVDSGGGTSNNSGYTLIGTIGQPDAGSTLSGQGYTLIGGFWGGRAAEYHIYLPLVLRA
jgi:hypothetical protein